MENMNPEILSILEADVEEAVKIYEIAEADAKKSNDPLLYVYAHKASDRVQDAVAELKAYIASHRGKP